MINGKFFTGLPPGMIERTRGTNRLESHLFWPDDTKLESAVENRVRRRASLQLGEVERPRLRTQTSMDLDDVDTKKRFHKEFAKSSIQFYDNIAEEGEQHYNPPARRNNKSLKKEITLKPTATKFDLPDEEYNTALKKKQTLSSKIQFYDFIDDDRHNRNNIRRPKMDMNDKKEVERNNKNSPKLQNKRNVRILSGGEEPEVNREFIKEQNTPERSQNYESDYEVDENFRRGRDNYERPASKSIAKNRENSHMSQQVIRNTMEERRGKAAATRNSDRVYNEQEDEFEVPTYSRNMNVQSRQNNMPKKILKNSRGMREEFNDFGTGEITDYIDEDLRSMRIRTSPKKHVSYEDEVYEQESVYHEPRVNDVATYRRNNYRTSSSASNGYNKSPYMKTGSSQQRQQFVSNNTDFDYENADYDQYMETGNEITTQAQQSSLKNNNYNNNDNNNKRNHNHNYSNNNNNKVKLNNQTQSSRKITPKLSATPVKASIKTTTTTADTTTTFNDADTYSDADVAALDGKKHLRSSICFSGGEIVANNIVDTKTPTSNNRRSSARSISASQRISVGLPD
ncbi:putative uncharacterized protein DDB_G0287457 [Teleopsis dalmanni]|uniref:putative uncharacterized protein DDB_G0287457 n=1 Tax=Teleopsis dalmanni TaxID=139649 RepID=UPI0018CE5CDB|nr:putative uncharacterized protein DDB_G0287457 [Teleopsis dalmanni]